MSGKPVVLFVCTRNSARSQMAEGWLRHLAGERFEVCSAGVEPGTLNPLAVKAMAEVGIDISRHRAKGLREFLGRTLVAYLIVVCDKAAETCPTVWPGMWERQVWPFDDPAAAEGDDARKLQAFREARDAIGAKLEAWVAEKTGSAST